MQILVSALEKSSNIHLKELMKHLDSSIQFRGIYSQQLGKSDYDTTARTIMGFVDVLKNLRYLKRLNDHMVVLAKDVDVVLLMDSSGFNLPLAKKIRKAYPHKKIYYYILPQAWVWKKGRIKVLEQTCNKLFSILPFESNYYQNKNKISYVGHPLLDQIKHFCLKPISNNRIAYMPGSRKAEINSLMPVFREVAKAMPHKRHILIVPDNFDDKFITQHYGDISMFETENNSRDVLLDVEFAYICSGTATLEAAILGVPFALVYIAKKLDMYIAKLFLDIRYIGLTNIMLDKQNKPPLHHEFIQDDVTVTNLLNEYKNTDKQKFINNSKSLRKYLKHGSSQTVARYIQNSKDNDDI
jgi:lipid-A-disaccharide synthase